MQLKVGVPFLCAGLLGPNLIADLNGEPSDYGLGASKSVNLDGPICRQSCNIVLSSVGGNILAGSGEAGGMVVFDSETEIAHSFDFYGLGAGLGTAGSVYASAEIGQITTTTSINDLSGFGFSFNLFGAMNTGGTGQTFGNFDRFLGYSGGRFWEQGQGHHFLGLILGITGPIPTLGNKNASQRGEYVDIFIYLFGLGIFLFWLASFVLLVGRKDGVSVRHVLSQGLSLYWNLSNFFKVKNILLYKICIIIGALCFFLGLLAMR